MRSVTNLISSTITNLQNRGTVNIIVFITPRFSSTSLLDLAAISSDLASVSSCSFESSVIKILGRVDLGFEKRLDTGDCIVTFVGERTLFCTTLKAVHCTRRNVASKRFTIANHRALVIMTQRSKGF